MDLNDSQKYKGRVKFRNLDPELQDKFNKSVESGTIAMKDFSPEFQNIITRILNTGSSGAGYNDTELREKIGSLDYNKADKTELKHYFDKNTDKVTYELINNDVATKIQNSAAAADLSKYRLKADAITYEDLDSKLKVKIDNASKSGGSSGSDSGKVDDSTLVKINERLNQHDTGIQTNAKNITALTNRINALGDTTELTSMPAKIQTNAQNIQKLTDNFNDLIGANDPNNKEPGHFGFNRLTSEVQNQIKVGTTALDSVNKLKTSVDKNTSDITSISSKVDNASATATEANTTANKNKQDIASAVSSLTSLVNGVDSKVNVLTLDDILNHSKDTANGGKIQETQLSSVLTQKINSVDTLKTSISEVEKIAQQSGSVEGTTGGFVYKGANTKATKPILYQIYLYPSSIDIKALKDNEAHLAGCASTNKLYVFRDGLWNEIAGGFLNELYSYVMYYDLSEHKFYYHDGKLLDELPTANTSTADITVPAVGQADWVHAHPIKVIREILALDTDTTSRSYNMYINAEAACTYAFNDEKMTAFNDTTEDIKLRIVYNG